MVQNIICYGILTQGEFNLNYFLILLSFYFSIGRINNVKEFQDIFKKLKSEISTLLSNLKQSGHNSSGEELECEVYDRFVGNHKQKKIMLFYCWLEWKHHFDDIGWLTRTIESNSSPIVSTPTSSATPSKKRKADRLIKDEMVINLANSLNNEDVHQSEIIKNNAEEQYYRSNTLSGKISNVKEWIKNEDGIFTEEQIKNFKTKLIDLTQQFLNE